MQELIPFYNGVGYGVEEDTRSIERTLDDVLKQQVELVPLRVEHNGRSITVPNRYATVREDGPVLGAGLSDSYELTQNREAFAWMDEMFDRGDARPFRSGALKGGSIAFVLAKLNRTIKIGGIDGEDIETFFLGANSFDGKSSLLGRFLPMRLVCKNGLMMPVAGFAREIRLRHTTGLGDKIAEADRVFEHALGYLDGFETKANALVEKQMSAKQFGSFLERLIPLPVDANPDKDRAARNKVEARDAIAAIFANSENLQNVRGTAWAAYNAVAEYADHHTRVRSTADDEGDAEDSRMENRFLRVVGDYRMKDAALELLTK
jgi:phage/plasmid-like protein (TIGR03299 family)